MANRGPNTNGGQFFITLGPHRTSMIAIPVFGAVSAGYGRRPQDRARADGGTRRPLKDVVIERVSITRT
jgi:peptidyl-prolyl cis-trans isomerase A (cyclophilin A)